MTVLLSSRVLAQVVGSAPFLIQWTGQHQIRTAASAPKRKGAWVMSAWLKMVNLRFCIRILDGGDPVCRMGCSSRGSRAGWAHNTPRDLSFAFPNRNSKPRGVLCIQEAHNGRGGKGVMGCFAFEHVASAI